MAEHFTHAKQPGPLHPGVAHPFPQGAGQVFLPQFAIRPAFFPFWEDDEHQLARFEVRIRGRHLLAVQGDVGGEASVAQASAYGRIHMLPGVQAHQAERPIRAFTVGAFKAFYGDFGAILVLMDFGDGVIFLCHNFYFPNKHKQHDDCSITCIVWWAMHYKP